MSDSRTVHFVVPDGVEDGLLPSGGNTYDRRLCQQLVADGWWVDTRAVAGGWPDADSAARRGLQQTLAGLPAGALVLVDGLVASAAPEALVPASRRLRLVVLVHMPIGHRAGNRLLASERAVLQSAAAVIATSDWSRTWLLATYRLDPAQVYVAQPGVDSAAPVGGTEHGGNLLCVAAVTPGKGHDVLLAALSQVADLDWRCHCVGALTRAPAFVAQLRQGIRGAGLLDRFVLTGPRQGRELDATYAAADALVLATRSETYGMVVTEALARGLPVLSSDVGGVPEALGVVEGGHQPGILVPPDDAAALAGALRRWLSDPVLRQDLRDAAARRRTCLRSWSATAECVARVVSAVAA